MEAAQCTAVSLDKPTFERGAIAIDSPAARFAQAALTEWADPQFTLHISREEQRNDLEKLGSSIVRHFGSGTR